MKSSTLLTAATALALTLFTGTGISAGENTGSIQHAHIMLGLTFAKAGDYVSAIDEFEKVLADGMPETKYARQMTCVYYEVGTSFLMTYDLPEAERYLNRAVLLERDCDAGRQALALTYGLMAEEQLELGNRERAAALFGNAETLVPDFNADRAYLSLTRNSRTARDAMEITTDLALTYRAIGREYAKENQLHEARKYYAMAAEIAPENGRITDELEDVNEAIAAFNDSRMAVAE